MTNEFKQTLCDIDVILNALPEEDRNKVPMKLRKIIEENKLENYESNIRVDITIEDQDIHPETQTFLAMLYLNYWCKDEEEKKELNNLLAENEARYQKELNEKYEVFKDTTQQKVTQENVSMRDETKSGENISTRTTTTTTTELQENQMVVYKENFIKRILNKVFNFFRRKENYGK